MRRLHVLKSILVRTHADKILLTYLVFVVIAALIIQIVEPGINRFVDALWYCYAVISTISSLRRFLQRWFRCF